MTSISSAPDKQKNINRPADAGHKDVVMRLTALWAFSEAALGGLLHAFRIPFTGLIVASFAVIIIAFIASISENKYVIIRSTLIVIGVKIIVSPQSPFTAHFAVLLQGFTGYLIYRYAGFSIVTTMAHGAFSLVYSAVQKLFTLTVIFGMEFWKSTDLFVASVLKEISVRSEDSADSSIVLTLITLYLLIYLAMGIFAGYFARILPGRLGNVKTNILADYHRAEKSILQPEINKAKKSFSRYLSFGLLAIFITITYFAPFIAQGNFIDAAMIFLRAVSIILFWIYLASPLFKRVLKSKVIQNVNTEEINNIISAFPQFKSKAAFARQYSRANKGISRIGTFISVLMIVVVFDE